MDITHVHCRFRRDTGELRGPEPASSTQRACLFMRTFCCIAALSSFYNFSDFMGFIALAIVRQDRVMASESANDSRWQRFVTG